MLERLLIAGQGGQGIVSAGRLLATVAVDHVPHVTFFPAYGAEVRGGTSNCQVVLSSSDIASPVCEQFTSMILMNEASVDRFIAARLPDARVIVSTAALGAVKDVSSVIAVDAPGIAGRLGNTRAANLVLVGAYLACRDVVPVADVEKAVADRFAAKGAEVVDLNIEALRAGLESGAHAA